MIALEEATNLAAAYIGEAGALLEWKDLGEYYAFSWDYEEEAEEIAVGNDPVIVSKETGSCETALIPALIIDKGKRVLLDALLDESGWQEVEGR